MSETIKVEFLADPKQIEAAAARAAAAMGGFATKSEKAAARVQKSFSISGVEKLQAEINALNMQRSGYENLANSMRESFRLKEQAVALANKENISIEQALTLLRQKSMLEKNIAAQAQQNATQAAAAQQKQIDLAKQKEAILARERAAYEAQSNAILGSTAAARKAEAARATAIANPRATGLPEMALTSQTLARMERAAFLQQDLARKTYMAGASGKAGALGFLAFSQAVEDAQYGMRGVLNNIPQMVLGFGGGAGLAGVLSLAAVAAYGAYKAFQNLTGATDAKIFREAAEEAGKLYESGLQAARAIRETAAAQELHNRTLAQESQYLNDRIQLQGQMTNYYDQQLAARKRQIDAEREIYQLALRNTQAAGGDTAPLVEQNFSSQQRNLAEELANRTKELATVQADLMRQTEVRENLTAEAGAAEIARLERVNALTKEKARLESDIAISQKLADASRKEAYKNTSYTDLLKATGIPVAMIQGDVVEKNKQSSQDIYRSERANVRTYTERLAEVNAELSQNETTEKAAAEARQKAISSLNESIDALNAKTNKTYQETEALKQQQAQLEKVIALERQYLDIQKNLKQIETLKDRQKTLKQEQSDLKDALKQAEEIQKKTREVAAPIEENAKRQSDTIRVGSTRAAEFAERRELQRRAEELAKGTTFDPRQLEKEIQRQQDLQQLFDNTTGSARSRSDNRTAQRAAEREAKRDDKRRESALNRENARRKREGLDPIDQPVDAAREANQKAEAERQKAADAREKNAENQLKTQQSIESLLKQIEPKLPAAVLAN